jgi:hypothetical protein
MNSEDESPQQLSQQTPQTAALVLSQSSAQKPSRQKVYFLGLIPFAILLASVYALFTAPNLAASRQHYVATIGTVESSTNSEGARNVSVATQMKFVTNKGQTVQGSYKSNFIIAPPRPNLGSRIHLYYNPGSPHAIYLYEAPSRIVMGIALVSVIFYVVLVLFTVKSI